MLEGCSLSIIDFGQGNGSGFFTTKESTNEM
jgi:hypothetical protein